MLFSKKWLQNHTKFLLHFQIHIDVLMLCRRFELIPTSIFHHFKNEPISEKYPVLSNIYGTIANDFSIPKWLSLLTLSDLSTAHDKHK